MANLDSLATRVLFWTGAELVSTHAAGPWIWEELCRHSSDVIEIGANIGFYTVVGGIAAPSRYTAYEPHPRSSQALRRNLELNGVTRVVAVEAAVVPQATEAGTVELICPTGIDRAMPTSSMVRTSPLRARLTAFGPTESFMVCAVPMLDAIKTCDLVKLDVEGLEADLLVAGWDVLVSQQPAIMVEIHDFSSELRSMLPKLLAEIGGSAYAMRRDHLVPAQTVHLERGPLFEKYGTWDYLLVPRSRASLVTGLVRT